MKNLRNFKNMEVDDDTVILCYNIIKKKLKKDFHDIDQNVMFNNYVKMISDHDLRYAAILDVMKAFRLSIYNNYNKYKKDNAIIELLYNTKNIILTYLQGFTATLDTLLYGIAECVLSFYKNRDYKLLMDNIHFINDKNIKERDLWYKNLYTKDEL